MAKKRKHEIFLDMDDVGFPFCKRMFGIYNAEQGEQFDYLTSQTLMLAENEGLKVGNDYFKDILHRERTFFDEKPEPGYVEMVKKLIDEGFEVTILTHPQWTSPYCVNEKIKWIETYLPFFDVNQVAMYRFKGKLAGKNRILLDDNPEHLHRWEENGGMGVSYAKIQYSQAWSGHQIYDFESFYQLMMQLEEEAR